MMRRICTVLLCAWLVLPSAAEAQQTTAPPGNSGIDQYVETVPGATGNRRPERKPGGTRGLTGETRRALEAQGEDGARAADLAAASAPETPASSPAKGGGGKASGPDAATPLVRAEGSSRSPVEAVVEAVAGGGGESGMGPILPILLALMLASMIGAALLRRRSDG